MMHFLRSISFFAIIACSCVFGGSTAAGQFDSVSLDLRVIDYDLAYILNYEEETLGARCEMTVVNPTERRIAEIPLLLYRLLSVDSVRDASGRPLPYSQEVTTFEDWSKMQKNFIQVRPQGGMEPYDTARIVLYYSGYLLGYTETGMLYVRDHIDTGYTILRPDCSAYPAPGYPSWAVNRAAGKQEFDYSVTVTVPEPLVVANGGRLVDLTHSGDSTTYHYENIKKAWRIDVAIARYELLHSEKNRVYYFREDSAGAERILSELNAVLSLYREWWGPLHDYRGFAVIEIPDGWGSQADVTAILQEADAFTDPDALHRLYHEISHLWNIESTDAMPCRWEEGLATFLEHLVQDVRSGSNELDSVSNRYLAFVRERLAGDSDLASTALADFGKESMTGYSYTVGMLLFRVLYDLVGPADFHGIIRELYARYDGTGTSTESFAAFLRSRSAADLDRFVQDWILTPAYGEAVLEADNITQLVESYR